MVFVHKILFQIEKNVEIMSHLEIFSSSLTLTFILCILPSFFLTKFQLQLPLNLFSSYKANIYLSFYRHNWYEYTHEKKLSEVVNFILLKIKLNPQRERETDYGKVVLSKSFWHKTNEYYAQDNHKYTFKWLHFM